MRAGFAIFLRAIAHGETENNVILYPTVLLVLSMNAVSARYRTKLLTFWQACPQIVTIGSQIENRITRVELEAYCLSEQRLADDPAFPREPAAKRMAKHGRQKGPFMIKRRAEIFLL